MMMFKFLWCVDALAAMIVLFFFFAGLADGTVSSVNMGLWFFILVALAVIMLAVSGYVHTSILHLLLRCCVCLPYLLFILPAVFGNVR